MRLSYLFRFYLWFEWVRKLMQFFSLIIKKYFFEVCSGKKRYFYYEIDLNLAKFNCNWDFILQHTVCFSICCIVCCSTDFYFSRNSNCCRHLWIRKSLFTRVLVFGDFIVNNVAYKFASEFSVFRIKQKNVSFYFL